ncbi:PREDICTED: uncharacterized protein LOC109167316 [Ipomoea nil]|uniref:uncharacterized protein LOC109167316 n=1 Tax=Ipomoea nil TaxID=35883 RepID=UPI000900FE32|nr:PREDICTED: uncharacterized protein LOC109167316 [Ipomoea nil]XP_019171896.1 PREDICTED: uncharacterized protein LOC109167316 [Ipomoea nil]
MPAAVWFSLKKSLNCRSEVGEVHDPNYRGGRNLGKISTSTRKSSTIRSGCSRSIANLKDVVIHGSKRHTENPQLQSPRSIGSSELLNPIVHEVVLNNSTCELKITSYPFQDGNGCGGSSSGGGGSGSPFVGTLKPGTPGPGGHQVAPSKRPGGLGSPIRIGSSGNLSKRTGSGFGGIVVRPRPWPRPKPNCGGDYNGFLALTCHKCGEQFSKWDAVESHHLSQHAVTQLVEGDSSRNIVEMICRTSWATKSDNTNNCNGMERILKVHNMQKTLAEFEEYRERVKIKASKLAKKHARCLADGNELLRFHGTTVECNLGANDSSSLCTSEKCNVCRILRRGFAIKKEINGGVGVFTASTSSRALEAIEESSCANQGAARKALIVCRVIAGRVHRPLENVEELAGQSGFDSLAGKVGIYSNVEELFLLDPRALLPCFVVICKA